MNRYNAQILNDKGEYHLQFETDSKDNFDAVEKIVQKCIDGKPRTNFDKITESVESLAHVLETMCSCAETCGECSLFGTCSDEPFIEWLKKECE